MCMISYYINYIKAMLSVYFEQFNVRADLPLIIGDASKNTVEFCESCDCTPCDCDWGN